MFKRTEHIHFVGIGGSGMSGIAEVLRNLGYKVSGSDAKDSPAVQHLRGLGCEIHIGHDAKHIAGAEAVVVSTAVSKENPEVRAAHAAGVVVIPRAEMLAELMRMKYGVAVAGAHGKTNTTSMTGTVLQAGGLDPTVVVGGRLKTFGSNARLGKGEFLVAEADESDGSFLLLSPVIAVVTNIDREHMEHHGSMGALRQAFVDFVNKVPFFGAAILCADDPEARALVPLARRRVLTYGTAENCDARAAEVSLKEFSSAYTFFWRGKKMGRIALQMPGRHTVLNSLAAVTVGLELGIPFETIRAALENCPSADRRFELKGEAAGVMVVDDYGHHPTEIRATLRAAREGWPKRRVVSVFQPHRYSRSKDLRADFARAFGDAHAVVVLPVYAAGEAPIEGITGEALAEDLRSTGGHPDVRSAAGMGEAAEAVAGLVKKGDIVITLGAGDVWKVGEELLARLGQPSATPSRPSPPRSASSPLPVGEGRRGEGRPKASRRKKAS